MKRHDPVFILLIEEVARMALFTLHSFRSNEV